MVAVLNKLSRKTLYLILYCYLREKKRAKYTKTIWVRKLFQERNSKGAFNLLIKDLRLHDQEYFFKFFRMTPTKYEELLQLVAPAITKCSIRRETIGPSERLTVTLKYIFAGTSQIDLAGMFRISPTTISRIIQETCSALWNILLAEKYISHPENETEWKAVADEFERKWNFSTALELSTENIS